MKYFFQFGRILAFCFLGELLHRLLPLPVPASIYGLVLLLATLKLGLVKPEQLRETAMFLTGIFPLLFIPAAVGIMDLWAVLQPLLIPCLIAIVPVTVLVMAVTGKTVECISGKRRNRHG